MIDGYDDVAEDSFPPELVILFCCRLFVGTLKKFSFGFYDFSDLARQVLSHRRNV